jgi:phytol kinase
VIDLQKVLIAGAVVLANGALFVIAELWKRTGRAAPESTRKLVHAGAGVLAIPLPWIFSTSLPVLVMGIFFTAALLYTRRGGHLKSVHDVERVSLGEIIYPAAIYLSFVLTVDQGQRALFPIPILALAFADAVAGLAGMRYGRHIFTVFGQKRSLEGSLAFLLTCTITTLAVLTIGTDLGTGRALAVAAAVGLTGAVLEAVSIFGSDNVTVPVGVSLVLLRLLGQG